MFSIFKKKSSGPVDLSGLRTDMHSHLLPGIDDGSKNPANSIELIRGLQDLGYEKFITTPHIFWDMYQNDDRTIGNAHQLLQAELRAQSMNVQVHPAAEYNLQLEQLILVISRRIHKRKFH